MLVGEEKPPLSHLKPEPAHQTPDQQSPSGSQMNHHDFLSLYRGRRPRLQEPPIPVSAAGHNLLSGSLHSAWLSRLMAPAGPASLPPALAWTKVAYKRVALCTPNI